MSADYLRRRYHIDVRRGDTVVIAGQRGQIVSFPDRYLGIRFDGETTTCRYRPTWRVVNISADQRQRAAAATALAKKVAAIAQLRPRPKGTP